MPLAQKLNHTVMFEAWATQSHRNSCLASSTLPQTHISFCQGAATHHNKQIIHHLVIYFKSAAGSCTPF
jgi:hypothetical protein